MGSSTDGIRERLSLTFSEKSLIAIFFTFNPTLLKLYDSRSTHKENRNTLAGAVSQKIITMKFNVKSQKMESRR